MRQPKRLRAVLFCNVLEGGEPDPRLVHRADPVTDENFLKFGINIWVSGWVDLVKEKGCKELVLRGLVQ